MSEIDVGIVIINDHPFQLIDKNKNKVVQKSTFLITFEGKIFVNKTNFENPRKIAFRRPETPIAHSENFTDHISILSLPYLHELNIKNMEYISHLHSKVRRTHYVASSLFAKF